MAIKNENVAVMIYTCSATLLYFTGFFSFFIFIPLIIAYYVRGYAFCKKSALIFFVFVMTVRVVSMLLLPENETEASSQPVESSQELPINSKYFLIYEVVYCMSVIIAVIVLLHSHFTWSLRILVATFLLFVSMYAQVRYIQDNLSAIDKSSPVLFGMLERISGTSHVQSTGNSTLPVFNEQHSLRMIEEFFSTVLFFTWAAAVCIIILNWFIAIMFIRRILGFSLDNYLRYVYTKIISSYSVRMPFILVFSILIAFLLRNSTQKTMIFIYNFFGNFAVVLLLCYMIYGLCTWYFILMRSVHAHESDAISQYFPKQRQNNLRLRSDWYFFAICGIMIIPFVNTIVIALCIVMGIKKNIQYIKNTYAMRSNDESNSSI